MAIPQDEADFGRNFAQEVRGRITVCDIGRSQHCRNGKPDGCNDGDDVQFPAIDPAVPAGFGEVAPACQSRYGELPLAPDADSCQTPPRARSTVLSMATARPQVAHGWMRLTR